MWSGLVLIICVVMTTHAMVDNKATKETINLFNRLRTLARDENKILFGQQEHTWLGAEGGHNPYLTKTLEHDNGVKAWIFGDYQAKIQSPDDLSDVKRMTGSYPAILGMDIGKLNYKSNITDHWLGKRAYERGEIITISMHHDNPITGGSPWVNRDHGDVVHTVRRLLPGGDQHSKMVAVLDEVASWAHSFTDSKGNLIPVIFRFMHELNGGWFWWGLKNKADNSPQDLQNLFRFAVRHLRDTRGVRNFIYAYSPDRFHDKSDYLKTYPGDEYVDVLGMDYYYTSNTDDQKQMFHRMAKDIVELAEQKNKIPAITETGYLNNGINTNLDFWKTHILDILKSDATTKRLGYILTWSNHCFGNSHCELWTPYKGHAAESNFVNHFYHDPITVFEDGLSNMYH